MSEPTAPESEKKEPATAETASESAAAAAAGQDSNEPKSLVSEEDKIRKWTFQALKQLLKNKEQEKFIALFDYQPNLLDVRDEDDGSTLLHMACLYDCLDVVHFFLDDEHLDGCEQNKYGTTAYHYAAATNSVDVIESLLDQDMDGLNIANYRESTPLHVAATCGHKEMVKFLLKQEGVTLDGVVVSGEKAHILIKDEDIKRMITEHQNKSPPVSSES